MGKVHQGKSKPKYRDYTVGGPESKEAIRKGLANGEWFLPQIERRVLRRLMQRDDRHAIRDTLLLAGIIAVTGYLAKILWDQERYLLFAVVYWTYCTFYTSSGAMTPLQPCSCPLKTCLLLPFAWISFASDAPHISIPPLNSDDLLVYSLNRVLSCAQRSEIRWHCLLQRPSIVSKFVSIMFGLLLR